MVKSHKMMILALLSGIAFKANSHGSQNLIDAITNSDVTVLESELKTKNVTAEEAKGLLEIANQVETIKKNRIGKAPRKVKILRNY